jgi:hypothetical protein
MNRKIRLITKSPMFKGETAELTELYEGKVEELVKNWEDLPVPPMPPMFLASAEDRVAAPPTPSAEPFQELIETIVMMQVLYTIFWKIWNNESGHKLFASFKGGKWGIVWASVSNLFGLKTIFEDLYKLGLALYKLGVLLWSKELFIQLYELHFTVEGAAFKDYVIEAIRETAGAWYVKHKIK